MPCNASGQCTLSPNMHQLYICLICLFWGEQILFNAREKYSDYSRPQTCCLDYKFNVKYIEKEIFILEKKIVHHHQRAVYGILASRSSLDNHGHWALQCPNVMMLNELHPIMPYWMLTSLRCLAHVVHYRLCLKNVAPWALKQCTRYFFS